MDSSSSTKRLQAGQLIQGQICRGVCQPLARLGNSLRLQTLDAMLEAAGTSAAMKQFNTAAVAQRYMPAAHRPRG